MTTKEFEEKMQEIKMRCQNDLEFAHVEMDNLMCELLCELGYNDGVAIFQCTDKWYA